MIGKPVVVSPKAPVRPCVIDGGINPRQELAELALEQGRLSRQQCIALLVVRELAVLAAADDTTLRGCPDVEIGIGSFPDAALPASPPVERTFFSISSMAANARSKACAIPRGGQKSPAFYGRAVAHQLIIS
jgi:hypothetical protein